MNLVKRHAACAVVAATAPLAVCPFAGAAWIVTELPTLGGDGSMEGWAINASGVVCGHGPDADGGQSVFRYDGTLTLLPHLDATTAHSVARDINSSDVIVGFSVNAAGRERAVYWLGTTITELPTPDGVNPDRSMRAEALNDAGVIVGYYNDDDWYAKDVNNHGLICGHAQGSIYNFWTYDIPTGTVQVLGTVHPMLTCTAAAVNDAGHIVGRGQSDFTSPYHALLHDGSFKILDPTVTDTQWSWDINNGGRVIGTARATGAPNWSWCSDGPGAGSIVPIELPDVTELTVQGINDRGVMVGHGQTSASGEDTRAFVIALAGDADGDGDVDLRDAGRFQTCFTTTASREPDCDSLDFNTNGNVDLGDFAVFEDSLSGPLGGP